MEWGTADSPSLLEDKGQTLCVCVCVCVLAVLGLELSAYTLSHSTSRFFVMGFSEILSGELFPQAAFEL
jgi:hypothetical protein